MNFKHSDKHVIPLDVSTVSNGNGHGLKEVAMPLPIGLLRSLNQVRLESNNQAVNCSAKICSYWHDGSIKWLFITFFTEFENNSPFSVVVHHEPQQLLDTHDDFAVTKNNHSVDIVNSEHKFAIDTNKASLSIQSANEASTCSLLELINIDLIDKQQNSLTCKVNQVKIETSNNLNDGSTSSIKVCICGSYHKSDSEELVDYELVFTFFKYNSYVKVQHTIHNPAAAIHPNGHWDLGDPNSFNFESLTFKFKKPDVSSIQYQCELSSKWQSINDNTVKIKQFSSGGENWNSPVHLNNLNKISHSICGYQTLENNHVIQQAHRAMPTIHVEQQYSITLEKFWQNFPKAISLSPTNIDVSLFPKQDGALHELQPGEKKSHVLWLSIGQSKDALEWVHYNHQINIPYQWTHLTKTLYPLALYQEKNSLCQLIKTGIDGESSFSSKREALDEFGWRNFGDIYADHETAGYAGKDIFVSHYNNQYDPLMGFLKQFLTTGNSQWFELADDLAKHIKDIDIYNTNKDKSEYNGGLFWHTDHYLQAFTSSHRSYSKHQASNAYQDHAGGGGPGGQHCYTSGLMLHHFLTASESSKKAVLTLSEWITNVYEGSGTCFELLLAFKNRHMAGFKNHFTGQYPLDRGTANYVVAMLDSYELTLDQTFLSKAEHILTHSVHPNENVADRSLDDVENTWFYTILLQALCRYLHIKLSQNILDETFYYCRDSLINYAQWMLDHEYPYLEKPDILEYPNDTWTAQDLRKAHVFASAYFFSADLNTDFLTKAQYFEDYVATKLNTSKTKNFTRILVLTMQNYGAVEFYQNVPKVSLNAEKGNWPVASYQKHSFASAVTKTIFSRLLKLSLKKEIEWLKKRLA